MTASVSDEASVEAAGAKIGRIVYNVFIPGSTLYGQIALQKAEAAKTFEAEAARYRTLPVKPALPEEARKYQVQAEAAINRKSFAEAADRYRDALKVAAWWPEGHFNRALILGEAGGYRKAIGEMKKYLMLVPDAPDANAAQDKIYEWEGLAGIPRGTGRN
jgi:tetratricopeptide (TPR) repeat protein